MPVKLALKRYATCAQKHLHHEILARRELWLGGNLSREVPFTSLKGRCRKRSSGRPSAFLANGREVCVLPVTQYEAEGRGCVTGSAAVAVR